MVALMGLTAPEMKSNERLITDEGRLMPMVAITFACQHKALVSVHPHAWNFSFWSPFVCRGCRSIEP